MSNRRPHIIPPTQDIQRVNMFPGHFRAYQLWLHEQGMKLFPIPDTDPVEYGVTPDYEAGREATS